MIKKLTLTCLILVCGVAAALAQPTEVVGFRKETSLNDDWATVMADSVHAYNGFEQPSYTEKEWKKVNVPHNWEDYQGYRRMKHGNLHGYAWYRKQFSVEKREKGKRYFLFFEGVGSYATVWVNGKEVGKHAGGRTSFTLDVTDALKFNAKNLLAVRADHPAEIRDLPWVCGGCSPNWGFSEGSQPMGIFRPVTFVVASDLRIAPFGVHVWNDDKITAQEAIVYVNTEVKNYSNAPRQLTVTTKLLNPDNQRVGFSEKTVRVAAGATVIVNQEIQRVRNPQLWSPESPSLYRVASEISEGKEVLDRQTTMYGIRTISWPVGRNDGDGRFLINGKPFFINGVCEYEHNMGNSHAFSEEMIDSRVAQIRAAGFNAFRDAHQPHNFRYGYHWDRLGIPWWTQFSAQIWFDTPEFRENFKSLLREWVKERRNSPAVVMWGLQNESKLPEDFAKECVEIIRELDPTTSSQRVVTTCNGGVGTDWNVIQNWSGTYGGDPEKYSEDMEKDLLNGEYGAWRSIDLHTEGGFNQKGAESEDRMTQLMEMKIRLAEAVKDKSCGQFLWVLSSHENPGRTQNGEGLRELDRVGPVNYKGLFTPWGEPVDAFYMYRANYTPKSEPMLYIAMHTWADRWTTVGKKDSIVIYSNCDEVELWCDTLLVGRQKRDGDGGIGTHFTFSDINITTNLLHAYGLNEGSEDVVASDVVLLHHLPKAFYTDNMVIAPKNLTQPVQGNTYLYRVNCGGPDYTDINGNLWSADVHKTATDTWGSLSWTDDYAGLPSFYASQRRTHDLIHGTFDRKLFQTFRYGQHKLRYEFPVPNGDYTVELYFVEPWYGRGGSMHCEGWRKFDVAINGVTAIKDLDLWKTAGLNHAHKEAVDIKVVNEKVEVSFPYVAAGQAVISAIAVSTKKKNVQPAKASPLLITDLQVENKRRAHLWSVGTWLDTGDKLYADDEVGFSALPSNLYGATYLRAPKVNGDTTQAATFTLTAAADIFVGLAAPEGKKPAWMEEYSFTQSYAQAADGTKYALYVRRFAEGETVALERNVSTDAPMYLVAATYVTTLEQASDLRPIQRIEAEDSKPIGKGVQKDSIRTNGVVRLTQPLDNAVEFTFSVGVADTYNVNIRYMNKSDKNIPMLIQIEDANGTVMRNDQLSLEPSPEDKFKKLETTTGTQINAGTYKLRLQNVGVAGVVLDHVEVQ